MRTPAWTLGLAVMLAACGGNGSTSEPTDDGAASGQSEETEASVSSAGGHICDQIAIDPVTFGDAIGRDGLEIGETGEADPDFFNVDGLTSCSVRFDDPVQPNRSDGYSVWEMPAASATAEQLAEGVVSLNPSGASSEALPNGFLAVRNDDLYLGMAGSNDTTTVYAQINPRLESPDLLVTIVQSVLDN